MVHMNESKLKFEERLYRWSLDEWNRELINGFKTLRTIHDRIVHRAIRIFDSYDLERMNKLAKAFAKRTATEEVIIKCSERPLTTEEKELIESFINQLQDEAWRDAVKIPPGGYKNREKFKKGAFKKAVITELAPLFGEKYEKDGGSVIIYKTPLKSWILVTYLDFGGRASNLNYSHYIMDKHEKLLAERISFLRWLGIGGETNWDELTNDDIESSAKSLVAICAHFIKAAPKLLEGIEPE